MKQTNINENKMRKDNKTNNKNINNNDLHFKKIQIKPSISYKRNNNICEVNNNINKNTQKIDNNEYPVNIDSLPISIINSDPKFTNIKTERNNSNNEDKNNIHNININSNIINIRDNKICQNDDLNENINLCQETESMFESMDTEIDDILNKIDNDEGEEINKKIKDLAKNNDDLKNIVKKESNYTKINSGKIKPMNRNNNRLIQNLMKKNKINNSENKIIRQGANNTFEFRKIYFNNLNLHRRYEEENIGDDGDYWKVNNNNNLNFTTYD